MSGGLSSQHIPSKYTTLDNSTYNLQPTEVDSLASPNLRYLPGGPRSSALDVPDTSIDSLQHRRSFSCALNNSNNNGGKSGLFTKIRRASTSIKSLLHTSSKKSSRDPTSASSSGRPSLNIAKHVESSHDVALRCKTASSMNQAARHPYLEPVPVSFDYFTGSAARASAATANQNALSSKHRNDSNIALSQLMGEDTERSLSASGADFLRIHQGRERRNSRVQRKGKQRYLQMDWGGG